MVDAINELIDRWVVQTFSPLLQKYGCNNVAKIRKLSIVWFSVFMGFAVINWVGVLISYITTNGEPHNIVVNTWIQILLASISLLGYYGYIFLDRILLSKDI